MPSVRNLTITAQWTSPIKVPEPGAKIVADATGATDGAVNPAFQALADRTKALAQGAVTLKALTVDGTGELAATPTPGNIVSSGDINSGNDVNSVNDINSGHDVTAVRRVVANQDVLALRDVEASRDVGAGENLYANKYGHQEINGAALKWTSTGTGNTDANPGPTVALSNDFRALLAPKAWAKIITTNANGFTQKLVQGGAAGMADVELLTGPNRVRFTMAQAMANTAYGVQVSGSGAWTMDENGIISTTQFQVLTGATNPQAAIITMMVTVFGQQNT